MPHRPVASTAIFILTVVLAGQPIVRGDDPSNCKCPADCCCCAKCSRCGQWYVAETDNFQACSLDSQATAKQLATTAESLRTKLQTKWLGNDSQESWNPKCQIVLHPNLGSYVCACGRGSEHTVGSSLVKAAKGRITSRQIDLLGGRSDFLTAALPHELTHVVLKDRFPSIAVPRWADEGAAILADTDAKQGRHQRDLNEALVQNTIFDAATLVTMEGYPRPERVGTFYGQSASLAEFLVNQGKPKQFVDFIELATAKGYDFALHQCYGIASVRDLDRQWRRQVNLAGAAKSSSSETILAAK
jgi:hypothetical protein